MNITITPDAAWKMTGYRVELVTPPQPFYHTVIQVTGSFGKILLTKIDLRHCTIWMADYHITEPVTLNGFANEMICQVYFPVPPSFDAVVPAPGAAVHLSATDFHTLHLPVAHTRILCIHYTRQYFDNGAPINEKLTAIFKQAAETPAPLPLNDAAIIVLRQIMNVSPASRFVHLYLDAKVKELLTLLYHLADPDTSALAFSEKEIELLTQVKNIIMNDLSRSYNGYELSKLTGTNAYTLKTNFKAWFGIPLHLFLHNCRMEKATSLLLTTSLSVKEIAYAVGYKNVSNFSETFKKYYGYPPSSLRDTE